MVDHLNVSYLYKKRGVFYFSKRVPCDVKSYYRSDRIVICLKTKSNVSAIRASKSLSTSHAPMTLITYTLLYDSYSTRNG